MMPHMKSHSGVKVHRFDPEEPTDTYVATLLPFGSTEGNTRERLARVAHISGYTILAAHAPGTGRPYLSGGRSLTSLWRSDISAVAQRFYQPFADAILVETQKADGPKRVIGWGDSGRASLMAALALHERTEVEVPIFQAVLARDGAVLEDIPILKGAMKLLREGGRRKAWQTPLPKPSKLASAYAGACSVFEMLSHCRLATSTAPREMLEGVAGVNVPFYYVGLTEGLAGSADDCRASNAELMERRDSANVTAPLVAELRDWAHGDLMWPEAAAQDLIDTATLAVKPRAPGPKPY